MIYLVIPIIITDFNLPKIKIKDKGYCKNSKTDEYMPVSEDI